MDANPLRERDRAFASRLAIRDPTVLGDIESAYGPAMRRLVLTRAASLCQLDAQEIFQLAMVELWDKYPPSDSDISVRSFLNKQVMWKTIDRLRNSEDSHINECQGGAALAGERAKCQDPPQQCIDQEVSEREQAILAEVPAMVAQLTERQQIAFKRRFYGPKLECWAKELESETGTKASAWRKASDDALIALKKALVKEKLIKREGEHYEVA